MATQHSLGRWQWTATVGLLAFLAAACASGTDNSAPLDDPGSVTSEGSNDETDEGALEAEADDTSETSGEPTIATSTTAEPDDWQPVLAAGDDASLPEAEPDGAIGATGFSRYVYARLGVGIVPTLIEGPNGFQYRCQDLDLPCSFEELTELARSGDPIPDELGLQADELATLVDELDATATSLDRWPTLEDACAAGMTVDSLQAANMGIHMGRSDIEWGVFDPAEPQQVLYGKEGGQAFGPAELGDCVDGEWTGEPGYETVGAVFMLPITPDHPDGFAGPIDNWHRHFNTCLGAENGFFIGDQEGCEANGGTYDVDGEVWMLHAYVDPGFEADTGVFAMWNNSIWPTSDGADIERMFSGLPSPGTSRAPIQNFAFGDITANVGQEIEFANADGVPHTVTDTEGTFDSGVFAGGQTSRLTFDQAGSYEIFCELHPSMLGTITIEQ